MLLSFAPWRVLFCFSTAPPHLAAPFGPVNSARPIKVVFLVEVFLTILTVQMLWVESFSVAKFVKLSFTHREIIFQKLDLSLKVDNLLFEVTLFYQ
jgi:hypothetical protein